MLKYVVKRVKKDFQVESGLLRDLFWSRVGPFSLFAPKAGQRCLGYCHFCVDQERSWWSFSACIYLQFLSSNISGDSCKTFISERPSSERPSYNSIDNDLVLVEIDVTEILVHFLVARNVLCRLRILWMCSLSPADPRLRGLFSSLLGRLLWTRMISSLMSPFGVQVCGILLYCWSLHPWCLHQPDPGCFQGAKAAPHLWPKVGLLLNQHLTNLVNIC